MAIPRVLNTHSRRPLKSEIESLFFLSPTATATGASTALYSSIMIRGLNLNTYSILRVCRPRFHPPLHQIQSEMNWKKSKPLATLKARWIKDREHRHWMMDFVLYFAHSSRSEWREEEASVSFYDFHSSFVLLWSNFRTDKRRRRSQKVGAGCWDRSWAAFHRIRAREQSEIHHPQETNQKVVVV